MLVNRGTETPEIDVSLTPLFYKNGGKSLRTTEIRATADELEKISGKLWALIKNLDRER
jgi:hypothetical protein